jgi:hypothetical protein
MVFNRRSWIVFVCCGLLGWLGLSQVSAEWKERKDLQFLVNLTSTKLPLTLRSAVTVENTQRLSEAESALNQILNLTGLRKEPSFRIVLHWNERETGDLWLDSFPRNLRREGKLWLFEIRGEGKWESVREQLYRSLAVCVLQSQMLQGLEVLPEAEIPDPPLWMSEGLTQQLLQERRTDLAAVVWRFSVLKMVPPLSQVEGWKELAEDGIRRRWQQSFCFWLFLQASNSDSEKKALLVYLASLGIRHDRRYWSAGGLNEDWWQQVTTRALKEKDLYYDWDQSTAYLSEATMIPVQYVGQVQSNLISITELPKDQKAIKDISPITETLKKLVELELRGDPLLKGVIKAYRLALESWMQNKAGDFARHLRSAREQQKQLTTLRAEATDFLDWFEVNYAVEASSTDYRDYAERVLELEKVRLDFREEQVVKRAVN